MKETGIIRSIDGLGRIVLPKEMRKSMDIHDGDDLEIFVENDRIILKKYAPCCIFCNRENNVIPYKGKLICADCLVDLQKDF